MTLQSTPALILNQLLQAKRPLVMGILNVTPDSFSDGNRFLSLENALTHARQMVEEGADIIDIGGESSRPGAEPVSEQEELCRVIPVIERLVREVATPISIDTTKPAVMRAAIEAGAFMINDVNALQEPGALVMAAQLDVPVCIMHKKGASVTMQKAPNYSDVVSEVADFLQQRIHCCERAGIKRQHILIDPGFGFGKTLAHNLTLLDNLAKFKELDLPILVGLSRKTMFGDLLQKPVNARLPASLSALVVAVMKGANIVRVHDVVASVDAVRVVSALGQNGVNNV